MHRPPALSFQVGRSRWHARALLAAMALVFITWCVMALSPRAEFPAWGPGLQALLLLLTAAYAAWAWRRSPVGTLRWDGERWFWVSSQELPIVDIHIVFDFQRLVLVSLSGINRSSLFLWLEPADGMPLLAWHALRRALVHTAVYGVGPTPSTGPEGLLP